MQRENDIDEDYYKEGEAVDSTIVHDYGGQLASNAYMPKEFLGMKTENLGFFIKGQQESPFMALKRKLIEESSTLKPEDRMQGVRYLCNIPYVNSTQHCVEAALTIVKDESIDIYKRFYFIDNKDKFFSLNNFVKNMLHPAFFSYGMKQGPAKVPFELMLISAEYIMQNYGNETKIRQIVLDWCLDIVENPHEDDITQVQVLQTLYNVGQPDEQSFAEDQLKTRKIRPATEVSFSDTDLTARGILRYLRTTYNLTEDNTPKEMFRDCVQYVRKNDNEPGLLKYLEEFFFNTISNKFSLELVSVGQITTLVQMQIEKLRAESQHMADEVVRRFVDSAKQGFNNSTELCTNILLSLEGFVTPKPLMLTPSLPEKLRNDLFAALNQSVAGLNQGIRDDVETARRSTDKSVVREFLVYFDDELDGLRKDYVKKYGCTVKEFDEMSTKIIEEWVN